MRAKQTKRRSLKWASRGAIPGALLHAQPVAVVRRARFEGNSFEVVESPSMVIRGQGYETEEAAQIYANQLNAELKGQTRK